MLKLVIVDDERLDMEGLKRQIDWNKYHISGVFATKDSMNALELIKQQVPDILITDIKMPGMTGLQLAKLAREQVQDIKIVFISGYDDFTYVKNAIKLNAYEYILKPVDTDELEACIKKVVRDILKEREEAKEKEDLAQAVQESRELLRNKLLLDLIFGTAEKERLWERIHLLGINIKSGSQMACMIEADDFMLLKERYPGEELRRRLTSLLCVIAGIEPEGCALELVRIEEHRFVAILSFEPFTEHEVQNNEVNRAAQAIIQAVHKQTELSLTIGMGTFMHHPSDLHMSFHEASQAVSYKIYEGKGRVLHYKGSSDSSDARIHIDGNDQELSKCLLNLDKTNSDRILDSIFDKFKEEKIDNNRIIQNYCIKIISNAQIILNGLKVEFEDIFGSEYILWDKLMRFETILDIRQWMKNIYGAFIDHLIIRDKSMGSRIINEVLRLIGEHYPQDVSLKEIANNLYYSPNYLGSLFRQQVGLGFAEYLSEYRIKKAAELIERNTYRIYEVASMVGYNDLQTFVKKFKSKYGVTPTEYRERFR